MQHFRSIKIGAKAIVTPLEAGFDPHEAIVTVVDKTIDAASNTFGVRLEIPNEDFRLPAGLKCEGAFDVP